MDLKTYNRLVSYQPVLNLVYHNICSDDAHYNMFTDIDVSEYDNALILKNILDKEVDYFNRRLYFKDYVSYWLNCCWLPF